MLETRYGSVDALRAVVAELKPRVAFKLLDVAIPPATAMRAARLIE